MPVIDPGAIEKTLLPIPHANKEQKLIAKRDKQAFFRFKVFLGSMLLVFLLFIVSQVT